MYKIKIALYNSQRKFGNDLEIISQRIVGINFENENTENTYSKQERMRVITPPESQRVFWREDYWDNLSEEYLVITANEPFIILLEESYIKIEDGKKQEENNKIREINAKELKDGEEDLGWQIVYPEDRKIAVVNIKGIKKEVDIEIDKEIKKPQFNIIEGGKNK